MELRRKYTSPALADVWEPADDSGLIFNSKEKPREVNAIRLCNHDNGQPVERTLTLAGLTHVRSVGCGSRGWTTHTRYTVYATMEAVTHERIVIARMDGNGPRFFMVSELDCVEVFSTLCATLSEAHLWTMLDAIVDSFLAAYRTGRLEEHKQITKAFVDGRLKKRKRPRSNQYEVWIEPVPPTPGPDGTMTIKVGLGYVIGTPVLAP